MSTRPGSPVSRVTLLTDFGTADGYVAAMKGVMASIAPSVIVDDASHEIPPGDVHAAAWALGAYWRRYPPGTVHVVVVDPGVGGSRRAIAVDCDGRFLVGPDNGVFTRVLAESAAARCYSITNTSIAGDIVSATFHGRDIFAPVAAYLATGMDIEELGPAVRKPVRLPLPHPALTPDGVCGEIIHVDRFGNLVSNIPSSWAATGGIVQIASQRMPLLRTYSEAAPGTLLALVGSRGCVEVSVRDGSAAEMLGVQRGEAVRVPLGPGAVPPGT